ncbi:MAG TPA: substrate-binding domain-containing protein [Reyranella sp.]|nr:substrate-binding domain-containing protein [Reyranella sp.]
MRVFLIVLLIFAGILPASAADLKLLTAGAFKSVALEIIPEFEKRTGHKVTVDNDTAGGLSKRVSAGEYFDVVVMPPLGLGPFLGSKVVESSAKALARAGIGVAVKEGAAKPDISSVDAFKKALLAARAIAYVDPASGGSSGIYLAKLFEKMGIAEQLKSKTVLVKGGLVAEKVASGEAEIGMQQASELLSVPGAVLVGPIPLEVQSFTIYAGAVSSAARDQSAADALLAALHGPDKAALLKKKGMELP